MGVLEAINSCFLGGAVPVCLMLGGVFFLMYLKGYPFRRPGAMLSAMTRKAPEEGISPFRAVTLALAGTLGVGNIVGDRKSVV